MVRLYDFGKGDYINLYQVTKVAIRANGTFAMIFTGDPEGLRIEGKERIDKFMQELAELSR